MRPGGPHYLGQYIAIESRPPLKVTTTTMTSTLASTGAAVLLLSLAAACGISSQASSADAGGDEGRSSKPDSAEEATEGTATDGGDAHDPADGHAVDAEGASTTDGASKTPPLNLRTSGQFAILSKGRISTVPPAAIVGDLGVSPAAATYITGFALTADATNAFSTSTQVSGKVYAADYALPTPSNLTTAVSDMELAFTEAAGRTPDFLELGAGDIGGMTLIPGVYKWGTSVLIPATITLSGTANDVWIFQVSQTLTMANATSVLLTGGAAAKNVFWQVAGAVDLGTTAHLEGSLLTQTSISLGTGASIKGRLLAQTSIDLAAGTVVQRAP